MTTTARTARTATVLLVTLLVVTVGYLAGSMTGGVPARAAVPSQPGNPALLARSGSGAVGVTTVAVSLSRSASGGGAVGATAH